MKNFNLFSVFLFVAFLFTIQTAKAQINKVNNSKNSKGVIFEDDFEADNGWTLEAPFEIGTAAFNPEQAHSGTNILGGPLNSDYANDQLQVSATSPVIDCAGQNTVILSYYSFSGSEVNVCDNISIDVYNGTTWTEIWSNSEWGTTIQEEQWTYYEFDVSTQAADNANFQVRFILGGTDGSGTHSGWGIDDFKVYYPEDNDLGVDLITPAGNIYSGNTFTPSVTIHNYGINTQSNYSVTLVSTPAGYDETIENPGSIDYGNDLIVNFPTSSVLPDGNYVLTATVNLSGDTNNENDENTSLIMISRFGELIWEITIPAIGSRKVSAVETNGSNIYCAFDGDPDHSFRKFDMNGTEIETFQIDENAINHNLRELAYNPNTGNFYCIKYNANIIQELDLVNQTFVGEYNLPDVNKAGEIAYDDNNNTFWFGGEDIYEVNEGTWDFTGREMHLEDFLGYGTAYDNWSYADKQSLWIGKGYWATDKGHVTEITTGGVFTGRDLDLTAYGKDGCKALASYDDGTDAYLLIILEDVDTDVRKLVKIYLAPLYTYNATFTVTDQNSDPVSDATITINNDVSKENWTLQTNVSGVAIFENLQNGTYNYEIEKDGYYSITGGTFSIEGYDEEIEEELTLFSNENDILTFDFENVEEVSVNIDDVEHTIDIVVPNETNLTDLTPIITISDEATISPESGINQNFLIPVEYTVTAKNGDEQIWIVTATVTSLSNENGITNFDVPNQVGEETIDDIEHTVTLYVETGTDVSSLVPTIEISTNATINPASGVSQNFTIPIEYTVTAENGDEQIWTVTVTENTGILKVNNNINIYPSPANNFVNIKAKNTISNIRIYNYLGQQVIQANKNDNIAKIDVSSLNSGVYFLKIETKGGTFVRKLIIQ